MPAASRFVEVLKKSVRARGMTYAELARRLRLSEASVKRMFSRGTFTLARVEEVLEAVDLDMYEVTRMIRAAAAGPAELTHEQELALAKDERLLAVFWLVLNGWSFEEIVGAFSITRTELTVAFARMEKLKLIDWGPGERARLRVPRDFAWRAGGPAKKAYGRRAMAEFLQARFDAPLEMLRFESRELSAESAALLKRKLERLVAEFVGRQMALGARRKWRDDAGRAGLERDERRLKQWLRRSARCDLGGDRARRRAPDGREALGAPRHLVASAAPG